MQLLQHRGASRALALVALGLAVAGPARPQGGLDGRWDAAFATDGSEHRQADVVIQGSTGSWTTRARGHKDKRDACVGRPFAIVLSPGPSATLRLQVQGRDGSVVCRDRYARLTIVDERTLEGEFDNGRVLRLTRQ